ncbi:MAG: AMP-binding protein [Clostridia bacterium]|nr:AMP-binding protein [Clostridia bacterium]MDD4375188.1 AMP-binding protein [Clostridia bacterium]
MLKKGELYSLKDVVQKKFLEYGDKVAYLEKNKKTKKFEEISFNELRKDVKALATVLVKKYNLEDEKIVVIGKNSYKWYMSYLAVLTGVGIIVPLDKELPQNEIENLLKRSRAKCIIYSDEKKEVISNMKNNLSDEILYINMNQEKSDDNSLSLDELILEGKKLINDGDKWYDNKEIDPESFKILMFTSGTTSNSKGVMLSHNNVISNLDGALNILKVGTGDRFFSVLPMHHIYESIVTGMYALANGSSVVICEGLKFISKDIKDSKPTVLVCVPLLVEHVCKKIDKTLKETKKEKIVRTLVKVTDALGKFGTKLKRKVFAKIHESLGGNLKYILVAAAPIEKTIIEQIEGYGYVVLQGYGLTETAPLVSATREETRKAGTVGQAANCEIRINTKEGEKEGEILVRGANVMLGYYEDEDATKEVIKDGWFYTGDIGFYDDEGHLHITGRTKNVIVTNNGKNIYPEEIEFEINKLKLVKESMVYGEGTGSDMSVSAIVTLDEEEIREFYNNDKPDYSRIKDKIWEGIKAVNDKMVSYKAVKNLKVRLKDFEKTTTLKIKRFLESNKEE